MEINNLNGKLEDEQNMVAQLQKKIKELQVNDVIEFPVLLISSSFRKLDHSKETE